MQKRFLRGRKPKIKAPQRAKMRVEALDLSMVYKIDFLTREKTRKTKVPQRAKMRVEALDLVGVTGFEPAASTSQMSRATNCATPRKHYNYITNLPVCQVLKFQKFNYGGQRTICYTTTQ